MSTSNLPIIGMKMFEHHPFKSHILKLLDKHFAPQISERFYVVLEVEKYTKKMGMIANQLRDQKYIAEVYYVTPGGLSLYVCDIYSWWPKAFQEAQLLRMITDKVASGQFGHDWEAGKDGRVNPKVLSHEYETKGEQTPL